MAKLDGTLYVYCRINGLPESTNQPAFDTFHVFAPFAIGWTDSVWAPRPRWYAVTLTVGCPKPTGA